MNSSSCSLCYTNVFSLHKEIAVPWQQVVFFEDDNVFVLPDISPLCVGHMLIVCKKHINSFGNASDDVFSSIKSSVNFLVTNVYHSDDVLLFEHGAVIENTAGASIDHAHMHALPLTQLNYLSPNDIDFYIKSIASINCDKVIANKNTLQEFAKNMQPYLFYRFKNEGWVYPVRELPSQFLRSLVAHYLNAEYDWRLNYLNEHSKKLYRQTLLLLTSI